MKRLFTVFAFVVMLFCFSSVSFATDGTLPIYTSIDTDYSVTFAPSTELNITLDVSQVAGYFVNVPIMGATLAENADEAIAYIYTYEGASWSVKDVVDGNGLPIPYKVHDNRLDFYCPNDSYKTVTFTLVVFGDTLFESLVDPHVTINQRVPYTIMSGVGDLTLSEWLSYFGNQLDAIEVLLEMLEARGEISNLYEEEIYLYLKQLYEASFAPAEIGGLNYKNYLEDILDALGNISIGDITGNITAQIDLTEVLTRLDSILNYESSINKFNPQGQMDLVPSSLWVDYSSNTGIERFDFTVDGNYIVIPYAESDEWRNVKALSYLNFRPNDYWRIQLMPGTYRIEFMLSAIQIGYNPLSVGFRMNPAQEVVKSELIPVVIANHTNTYSAAFDVVLSGQDEGIFSIMFDKPVDLRGSRIAVRITALDSQLVSIDNQITELKTLLQTNNETLTDIGLNVEKLVGVLDDPDFQVIVSQTDSYNDQIGQEMDSYFDAENDSITDFNENVGTVQNAISDWTGGISTAPHFITVTSFVNGQFTNIWNALGDFKWLVLTPLIVGIALVFTGRSGKVR